MENNHGFQIEKLKNSFNNILQIIEEIMYVKSTANNTLQKLKDIEPLILKYVMTSQSLYV